MAQSIQPGRFGHIGKPDDAWLAKHENELILEPELPIIDTHHHLWDRNGWIYLLPELLADLNSGHNIVATVFEECRSMYRADGPVEMRPVGEVEFVAGIAAMSESGGYGSIKVAQGIVGYADLALGDRVEPTIRLPAPRLIVFRPRAGRAGIAMELFTQLFGDLLAFVYHCFDRIVIYGYLSGLSRPEQVVHFFRQVVGVPVVSKEVLSQRTAPSSGPSRSASPTSECRKNSPKNQVGI